MARLVVVSNRVSIPDPTGKSAAGGLAVALREALDTQDAVQLEHLLETGKQTRDVLGS